MNCKKAETFTMQHFEKNIKPANARKLAMHVLICKGCREFYLTLDEAMDTANEETFAALSHAPENFTDSIMAIICTERAYLCRVQSSFSHKTNGWFALRILWGFSAVFLGVCLLFALNPDLLYYLAGAYPVVGDIATALNSVALFIGDAAEWAAQNAALLSGESLGITALLFVAVMGTLLYVLHDTPSARTGDKVQT